MSQTISTKYLNATNTNGARIKAFTPSGQSITVPYNYGVEAPEAHAEAAQKLKTKLGWKGKMHGGNTKDGYVFVFADGLQINPVPPLKSKRKTVAKKSTEKTRTVKLVKNPIKKTLTARPSKAKTKSVAYVVELKLTESGAWKGQGIFPSKELASQYANAIHEQHGGNCFVRVTV